MNFADYGRKKTPARLAVECALRSSSEPLTMAQLAKIAGLCTKTTASHMNNILEKNLGRNVGTRHRSLYVWGPRYEPMKQPEGRYTPSGTYDGADLRPFSARAGAMDAYALPSVQQGQLVERRLPISLGAA